MKTILVSLTCNICGWQSHLPSDTLILPEFDPDTREELLRGNYFKQKCPKCGNIIHFLHPCLYVDKKNGFIIYLKGKELRKESDHEIYKEDKYHKRYVDHEIDLIEKIHIFEDRLDDRVIKIIQQKLQNKYHTNNIYYQGIDHSTKTIWFTIHDDQPLGIYFELYQNILKNMKPEDYSHFLDI